jgi:DNA mismatch repair protein MutS
VDAKKMRHLLIECLDKNEIYVPNDICLGRDKSQTGILLYGTNAVGKTSLIKALGICVIMAQSGFYVPCESFVYCPYQYIFTRIIGNDNLFKGLSTFGVEMSELRVILQMANQNSLILGDELCSGTEIDSALSIFISSLETLSQRQSTFIFATHFHELQQMQEMKQLPNICCKHLKVQFDYEKQQLYYDRKLQDGQGESIYGLEVCKSLKLPESFLTRCYEIRNEYIQNKNNILLLKTSKYNKDKLRNVCEFCNENMGTEIHHMQYQKDANKNDYIENSFHKNHSANLASVCQKCHQHIHALNLKFERKKNMDGNYELFLKKIEYKNE